MGICRKECLSSFEACGVSIAGLAAAKVWLPPDTGAERIIGALTIITGLWGKLYHNYLDRKSM